MSSFAKKPLAIPPEVTVTETDGVLKFDGKKGSLTIPILPHLKLAVREKEIEIGTRDSGVQARANWGTMASLVRNSFMGVMDGFTKELEIQGVGYRASIDGKNLVLNVGFTHSVIFPMPAGIIITVEKNFIKISGIDKAIVGETAAQIRKIKKPEPYKGKGIRYVGEIVRRKAGKKVAGTTA